MSETWKAVPGWEGRYEVSDEGRVKGHRGRLITPEQNMLRGGYLQVRLYVGRKAKRAYVHRLVTEAFVGPLPAGQVTRHLNGNPTDNRLSNLAYGTPSENSLDTVLHGRNRNAAKGACDAGHPFEANNVAVDALGHRQCVTCRRESVRAYWDRLRSIPLSERPHGTRQTYSLGCRCEPCRAARRRDHVREKQRRARVRAVAS